MQFLNQMFNVSALLLNDALCCYRSRLVFSCCFEDTFHKVV